MGILKIVLRAWCFLKKPEVISGLFVNMVAVFVAVSFAFWLDRYAEQKTLNRATEQRLHLAALETQYNGELAKEIVDIYAKTNIPNIYINRPDSTAATTAFQDSNVLLFLPIYKVSLLKSYIKAIATLNQAMEIHQRLLESAGYKQTSTQNNIIRIRQNVRSNAASVLAVAFVLQEELNELPKKTLYDHDKIKEMGERVKLIKAKALKGEVSLSKE